MISDPVNWSLVRSWYDCMNFRSPVKWPHCCSTIKLVSRAAASTLLQVLQGCSDQQTADIRLYYSLIHSAGSSTLAMR